MSLGSSPLITLALNEKPQSLLSTTPHPRLPALSALRHDGIAPEESFSRILALEQKRTERSGNPFLLMLLEAEEVFQTERGQGVLPNLLSCVSKSVRQTDIVGWFKENLIVGVIYTEVGSPANATYPATILERVVAALRQNLRQEEVDSIGISLHMFPDKWDERDPGSPANLDLYPDLRKPKILRRVGLGLKRLIDVAVSLAALILLSPLFGLIAALIKLTSSGPVFFRQSRVGRYGKEFTFLKFRTMDACNNPSIHKDYVRRLITGKADLNEDEHGNPTVYKLVRDPRVTRFGKLLRRSSLDELPQLVNVFKGEMSLVGPRPPIQYEWDVYKLWHRRRLLEAKPGITGLWQVSGRSKTTFDDMVRLDLRYVRAWSLWLDLKILLKTPQAVLSGEGAY